MGIFSGRSNPALGEATALDYPFPASLRQGFAAEHPDIEWAPVETGLREWFVILAHRGDGLLFMPSRAVDEAWRLFGLEGGEYLGFSEEAFGSLLARGPELASFDPVGESAYDTVRAWDRSEIGDRGGRESVLWDLDRTLGIDDPVGISADELLAMRSPFEETEGEDWMFGAGGAGGAGV